MRHVVVGAVLLLVLIMYITRQDCKDPFIKELKETLEVLDPRFKQIPIKCGNKSYTENKSVIVLCLRDPQGRLYDRNTIIYVAIHEFTHVLQKKYDPNHGPEFQSMFDELLTKAARMGIYDPNKPLAPLYCGVSIPEHARTPLKGRV